MADEQDAKFDSRKWGFIGLLFGVPIYFLGVKLGHADKGLVAGVAAGMLVLIGAGFWAGRDKVWYWAAIAIAFLLHCMAVSFIHFDRLPGPTVLVLWPFAFLDLIVLVALFKSAQKLAASTGTASPT